MSRNHAKSKFLIVLSFLFVAIIAIVGYSVFNNNAGAETSSVFATQASDILRAGPNKTDGDTSDTPTSGEIGEVAKGDIIDYYLTATYTGFGDGDKSGIVTFTDVLPEYTELVTGNQTVAGKTVDCTPNLSSTGTGHWLDSQNPYTYDSGTRTFTAKVSEIPASSGEDTGNVVSIHIYVKIKEDASSLSQSTGKTVRVLYYTNYLTLTHASASSTSDPVQFYSGNPSEETYTVSYRFKNGSPVPSGVTAPVDSAKYSKGANITVKPAMKAQGYTFSGWKLVTSNTALNPGTNCDWDEKNPTVFNLHTGTDDINSVTFEGSWSANSKIDVKYEWGGKATSLSDTNDSDDDKPNIDVPASVKADSGATLSIPTYPATEQEQKEQGYDKTKDSYTEYYNLYKFLGWKITLNYSDNTSSVQSISSAEYDAKEFVPAPTTGKTLSGVTLKGYWTKKAFNITYATEGDLNNFNSSIGVAKPTTTSLKWGKDLDLPVYTPTGYRFNGWRTEPDLGEGVNINNGTNKRWTMPTGNLKATASFTKLYKVTVKGGGTASAASVDSDSDVINVGKGEQVTIHPLQGMQDVQFNDWTTTLTADANNWIKQDDGTASFVMPENDVEITGKYNMEIDFLVVNGYWSSSDQTSGYKIKKVDVTQQTDKSWKGTLSTGDVPTGMVPDSSHKAPGKWGDGTTQQNPTTLVGTDKITSDNSGSATVPTLFTYAFNDVKDSITIKYKVKDDHKTRGSIKLNSGGEPTTGELSESIHPLNGTPVGAVATSNEGYKFAYWTKNDETLEYSIDANFVPSKIINTGGDTEFYEECTYVANFTANTYQIKFDGNGATSGSMDNLDMEVGTRKALTGNAFVKEGFKFGGWTTKADYSGEYYSDKEEVIDLSKTDGDVVTLYAKWVQNSSEVVPIDPQDPNKGSLAGFANDIRISVAEANRLAGITGNNSVALTYLRNTSGAYFTYSKPGERTTSVDVASIESNSIKPQPGTYSVTLKSNEVSGKTASVSFNVYVYDKSTTANGIIISANNFTVSADEVKAKQLNDGSVDNAKAELIRLANAKAINEITRDNIDITEVVSEIAIDGNGKGVKGIYDVTFRVTTTDDPAKTTEVTVQATVTDYADEKSDMRISAHDFAISVSDAGSMQDSDFINAANAKAISTADSSELNVNIDRTSNDKTNVVAKRGKYIMTFYTESATALKDGPEVTVNVLVTDNVIDDPTTNHVIVANDFTIGVSYVDELNNEKVIKYANARAYDKRSGASLSLDVDFSVIEGARGNYYPVKFSTDSTSLSVACIVTDQSSEPSGDSQYMLSANDFSVTIEEAQSILSMDGTAKDNELIKRAYAKAVLIETGEYVDYTSVDSSELKAVKGVYPIKFILDDNNSITVDCIVGNKIEPGKPVDPSKQSNLSISASDFTVDVENATTFMIDKPEGAHNLIAFANAQAWRNDDRSSVQISDVESEIELRRGSYDVTFFAELYDLNDNGDRVLSEQASITIKATITDKQVVPEPDIPDPEDPKFVDIAAYANDFVVSVDDVKKYKLDDADESLEKLIELGNVSAKTIVEQSPVDIVSAVSTIKPVKGTFDVTYTTDEVDGKSVDITSNVRVTDSGASGKKDDETGEDYSNERIYANNIAMSKAEADAIDDGEVYTDSNIQRAYAADVLDEGQKELIRLSHAFAYRIDDGYELPITKVDFQYTGTYGDSIVTFATEHGTSVDVIATVTSNSSENAENQERIVANDVSYTFEEAKELLGKSNDDIATKLKDDAVAKAYSTVDGSDVDVVKATWNIQTKGGVYDVTFSTEKGTSVTVKANVGEEPIDLNALAALSRTGDSNFPLIAIISLVGIFGLIVLILSRRRNRE